MRVQVRVLLLLVIGAAALACGTASAQSDILSSREVTVLNNAPVVTADAVARELSAVSVDSALFADVRPASREESVLNWICTPCAVVSSSSPASAYPVFGTLSQQLAALNAGPPAFTPETWNPVNRRDDNSVAAEFRCGEVADPLALPYVNAARFLDRRDEVTYDNCSSAFYRFTFELPATFTQPVLIGSVNADDQAVIFLNGHRITGAMNDPGCEPGPSAADSCYGAQDTGGDAYDPDRRAIMTRPSLDTFAATDPAWFLPGENELVFGVAGDAGWYDPTGLEFVSQIAFVSGESGVGEEPLNRPRPGLAPPHPNPVGRQLRVSVTLVEPQAVQLDLFDVSGRRVRQLIARTMEAGSHALVFNLSDPALPAQGLYFLRLKTPTMEQSRRLVVVHD